MTFTTLNSFLNKSHWIETTESQVGKKKAWPLLCDLKLLFKYASVGTEYQVVGEKLRLRNAKLSYEEC